MWAIIPRGVGNEVGARRIEEGWDLVNGETFVVEYYDTEMILAEDGVSLRFKTQDEINAAQNAAAEQERVVGIKDEARARIISHIPGGTKNNYLEKENHLHAQYSDLQDIQIEGGVLTTEQRTYKDNLKARFRKMDEIISMSNAAEANGDSIDKFKADLDAAGL